MQFEIILAIEYFKSLIYYNESANLIKMINILDISLLAQDKQISNISMWLLRVQFRWVIRVDKSIEIKLPTSNIIIKLRLYEWLIFMH